MSRLFVVDLTDEERTGLREVVRKGKVSARKLTRAHILLRADESARDKSVAEALHVHVATVERVRRRFVEGGVDRALTDRPRPGMPRKLNDKQQAYLIALACSDPPDGRARWTLRLLADKMVQLEVTEGISHETVRKTLIRGAQNPG